MATTTAISMLQPDIELARWRDTSKRSNPKCETAVGTNEYDSIASSVAHEPGPNSTDHTGQTSCSTGTHLAEQRAAVKTLIFTRPIIFSDITISNALSGSELYHAATTEIRYNTPDVTLHAGGNASGPVLGVAHFRWTRDCKLGIGDPDNEESVRWEELKNTSPYYTHSKYEFEFTEQNLSHMSSPTVTAVLPSQSRRRSFLWRRTVASLYANNTWAAWWSRRHYELVDNYSGDVVAVFLANNMDSLTKKGELRFFRHVSKELEMLIVLTMASISEKATRRARYTRHHGAAGC